MHLERGADPDARTPVYSSYAPPPVLHPILTTRDTYYSPAHTIIPFRQCIHHQHVMMSDGTPQLMHGTCRHTKKSVFPPLARQPLPVQSAEALNEPSPHSTILLFYKQDRAPPRASSNLIRLFVLVSLLFPGFRRLLSWICVHGGGFTH